MGQPLLITPSQLWTLLLNRYRMTPKDFDPGNVSDVAHTGSSTGTIRVTDLPYDAYSVDVAVLTTGDAVPSISPVVGGNSTRHIDVIGTPKGTYDIRIEVMATNYFRYSLTGGASYSILFSIPTPTVGKIELPGTGLTVCWVGTFTVGDLFTLTTIGPARVAVTTYTLNQPLIGGGTGTIVPSGQVLGAYVVSVCVCEDGKFVYSVNGGKPTAPAAIISSITIPCVGMTLTFDPGCGPTTWSCGSQWIFSTRGSATYDISAAPIPLARPEQTGLRLVFEQAGVSPAYIAGDTFSFSTTAPPDMLEECRAASDEALAKLRARYMNQVILAWDRSVVINAGRIALGTLYDRKGQNWQEDRKSIEDKSTAAHAFFTRVGSKLEHPEIVAMPLPGTLAPRVVLGPDPTRISEGPYGGDFEHGILFPGRYY